MSLEFSLLTRGTLIAEHTAFEGEWGSRHFLYYHAAVLLRTMDANEAGLLSP
jgi:hypothetical protein